MRRGMLTVAVAIVVLTGCVTKSKYEALESQANADRTALAKEVSGLQSEKQGLDRQVTGLRDEVAGREAQIAAQKQQAEALQRQIHELNDRAAASEKRVGEVSSQKEEEIRRLAAQKEEEIRRLATQKDEEIQRLRGTYDSMVKSLEGEIAKGEIKVKQIQDRLSVQMVDKILFDSGKTEIKPQGREILAKVATVLASVKDKHIRIEGYTDSQPITGALQKQFPSNWELSAHRATTVVRFLQDKGSLDGKVLSAVGYGPFRPIADNETPEGRAENRRIEIVLTPLDAPGSESASPR
jgi:chemotaxis protein MotB